MPAKDIYHDIVIEALKADGWAITNDPLYLAYGNRGLYVDLGAEHETLAAEKNDARIAIEIKSFISPSPIDDLRDALGAYVMYRAILEDTDPDRLLFLAVSKRAWNGIFAEQLGQLIIEREKLRLVIYDVTTRSIVKWIN